MEKHFLMVRVAEGWRRLPGGAVDPHPSLRAPAHRPGQPAPIGDAGVTAGRREESPSGAGWVAPPIRSVASEGVGRAGAEVMGTWPPASFRQAGPRRGLRGSR